VKFDRKHDIPYRRLQLGQQDRPIDRHVPLSFKFRGRTVGRTVSCPARGGREDLIDRLGLHYLHAHQIATREQAAVRAAGVSWRV
jgi:hypothetical protein